MLMFRLLNRVNLCLYLQAIDGVNKGQIKTEDKLYELKALQESNKSIEVSRCMADDSVFVYRIIDRLTTICKDL